MNRREVLVLFKNSISNLFRGATAAVVALLLPPFLTEHMSKDAFAAWSLVLQVSAYVGYLDFGIQTAVGRFVAHANERNDSFQRDRIISTSLFWLCAVAALAGIAAILGAFFLPHIFPQMPGMFVRDSQIALGLVGVSVAVALPAIVFNGVFVGMQRNEIPAFLIGGSRMLSAFLMIVVVRRGHSIVALAVVTAAVNVAAAVLQWVWLKRQFPTFVFDRRLVDRSSTVELFQYCKTLTIWNFAMFLVAGLDLTILGVFRFSEVAYYSVASSLVLVLAGVQNAVFSAMIAPVAVLHARGDGKGLSRLLIVSSRYGMFLLLLMGLPLVVFAYPILAQWLNAGYAGSATPLLQILVVANVIRLSGVPYISTLVGTGEQKLATVSPLLEGFANLVATVVAVQYLGAAGVALGTVLGAVVGLLGNLLYNMRHTREVSLSIPLYLLHAFVLPVLPFIPFLLLAVVPDWRQPLPWVVSTLASLWLMYQFVLRPRPAPVSA